MNIDDLKLKYEYLEIEIQWWKY